MKSEKMFLKFVQSQKKGRAAKMSALYSKLCEAHPLRVIHSTKDHRAALKFLDGLLDEMGKCKPKAIPEEVIQYMEALALMIATYEKTEIPKAGKIVTGVDMLAFLMEQNELSSSDLSKELGGKSVASLILSGKRKLNVAQIDALAKRFEIAHSIFFDS